MRKQTKMLIIALSAAVVLIAAVVLLSTLVNDEEGGSSSTGSNVSHTILDEDEDEVVSYEINNKNGSFTILTDEDDELYIKEYEGYPQSYSNYTILKGIVCSTSIYKIDNPNLTEYGLETPAGSVKITFSDGKTETVYVGDKATFASAGGYYVKKDGDDSVYVLSQSVGELILARKVQFLDLIISKYSYEAVTDVLKSAEFSGRNIAPFKVAKAKASYDGSKESDVLELPAPYDIQLDTDKSESVFSQLFNLYASDVEQLGYTDADLKRFGLSSPLLKYTLNCEDGNGITVSVGDLSSDGYYYVINHGVNIVYKVRKDELSKIVGLTPEKLIGEYAIVKSINIIKNITLTVDGDVYSYDITHDKEKTNISKVTLNGKDDVDTNSFKNFYAFVVGCDVSSVTLDTGRGKLLYKIDYSYKDGSHDTYEYFDMGERKYKAVKNGTSAYIFQGKEIKKVSDALNKLLGGEIVESPIE